MSEYIDGGDGAGKDTGRGIVHAGNEYGHEKRMAQETRIDQPEAEAQRK